MCMPVCGMLSVSFKFYVGMELLGHMMIVYTLLWVMLTSKTAMSSMPIIYIQKRWTYFHNIFKYYVKY